MNAIQNFAFDEHLVRVVEENGEPWFVATDVCACLDIKNTSQATQSLDRDEIGICLTYTNKGSRETLTISISGLATLMVRSRLATTPGTKPHRFRRWIFGEVLPQIQKTGEYRPNRKEGTHEVSTHHAEQFEPLPTDRRQALAEVREARLIYGTTAARLLWEASPHLPQLVHAGRAEEISASPSGEVLRTLFEFILDDDMRNIREAIASEDRETLEAIGLRLVTGGAWLLPRHPRLWPRWQATRWRDGHWVTMLKRLEGVTGGHERVSIGNHQGRPIWLPASVLMT